MTANYRTKFNKYADGRFFNETGRVRLLRDVIIETYDKSESWKKHTALTIIEHEKRLLAFTSEVLHRLRERLKANGDTVGLEKLDVIQDVRLPDKLSRFSFCEHVAKRLLLCRKAGLLNPRGDDPRYKKKQKYGLKIADVVFGGVIPVSFREIVVE